VFNFLGIENMKKILISLMIVLLFVMVSCDSGTKIDTGNTGDSGNTGDTGNSGDTGDICPENDKFCHSHDGLDWSDASSDYVTWDEAVTYCENLGGRLPTISELRTLIQNCPATESGGACKGTDDCLHSSCYGNECRSCSGGKDGSYSKLGDTVWFWSASERSDAENVAWNVNFANVHVDYSGKNGKGSVRCVR
jgi:uncharacterized protein (TIGR02145 family)